MSTRMVVAAGLAASLFGASLGWAQAFPGMMTASQREKVQKMKQALERFDRLPDLTAVALASGTRDIYAEQDRLAREYDARKKPYRVSVPYRNPSRPCKSGGHSVASIRHTLVNPTRSERVELWEAELHEAQVHGAALPAAVLAFFVNLVNVD